MVNCLIFSVCYLQNLYSIKKEWSLIGIFLKLWHYQISLYLFEGFQTIIMCSVHLMWIVKYVFSAKIWFAKMSTRIVKYESQVVKLNPRRKAWKLLLQYLIKDWVSATFEKYLLKVLVISCGSVKLWPLQKILDRAILGNSFKEIIFFIHFHVLFKSFRLFWK